MRNMSDLEMEEAMRKIANFMGGKYITYSDNYSPREYRPVWVFLVDQNPKSFVPLSIEALICVLKTIERNDGCIVEIWMSLGYGCRIYKFNKSGISGMNFRSESNDLAEAIFETIMQYIDTVQSIQGQ